MIPQWLLSLQLLRFSSSGCSNGRSMITTRTFTTTTTTTTTPTPSIVTKSFPYGTNSIKGLQQQPYKQQQKQKQPQQPYKQRIVLYWYRLNDLRIHDHPALLYACKLADMYSSTNHNNNNNNNNNNNDNTPIIPVFHFDTFKFVENHSSLQSLSSLQSSLSSSSKKQNHKKKNNEKNAPATPNANDTTTTNTTNTTTTNTTNALLKCGVRRAQWIIQCVTNLRQQLETKCHSHLVIGYNHINTINAKHNTTGSTKNNTTSTNTTGSSNNSSSRQFFHTLLTDIKQYYLQRFIPQQQQQQQTNNNIKDVQQEGEEIHYHDQLLQFDVSIICQDEPVREERMQVYHISKILQYHNNHMNSISINATLSDIDTWWKQSQQRTQQQSSILHNPSIVQQIWGSTLYMPKQMSMHVSFNDMPNAYTDFIKKLHKSPIHPPLSIPIEYYNMPFPVGLYPLSRTNHMNTNNTSNNNNTTTTTTNIDDDDDDEDEINNNKIQTTDSTATAHDSTAKTTTDTCMPITNNNETKRNPLTYMPTLHDLGYTHEQITFAQQHHPNSTMKYFVGGEIAALQRVQEYIWDLDLLRDWAMMRSLPILQNRSTKFSPYLAHGCLSPRTIAMEVKKYYKVRGPTKGAPNAMVLLQQELRMRDYNKFYCIKHGDGIFQKTGALPPNRRDVKPRSYLRSDAVFTTWKEGRTGYPFVDATMREIAATGYASHHCRLSAASFFVHDMKQDWRWGAQYYEEQFIDYDVYLNWWGWCDVAGFTTGKVFQRRVIAHDGMTYDPMGEYVKLWVPELVHVPKEYIHEPWKMNEQQQIDCNVRLGIDYANPFIDPKIGEERRKGRTEKRILIRSRKSIGRF